MFRPRWRHAKSAIAEYRCRYAMPRRDRHHSIPDDLRIIMCVYIYKTGRNDRTLCIYSFFSAIRSVAQSDNSAIRNAHISMISGTATAIDDGSTYNFQIIAHVSLPLRRLVDIQAVKFGHILV